MTKQEILVGLCENELKKIPDNSIDMIFTSPPYADRRKNTYGGIHAEKYVDWFHPIALQLKRVLKPSGSFFLNIKPHTNKGERVLYVHDLVLDLKRNVGFRFTDEFCWTKNGVPGKFKGRFKNAFEPIYHFTLEKDFTHNPYSVAKKAKDVSLKRYKRKACGESSNGSGFAGMRKEIKSKLALPSNHIHIPQKVNQHTMEKIHSAVFPVDLVDFFIKAFSNEGDVVLDCFAGSGSTGISCINNKRGFVLIEKETQYCELIKNRIKLNNRDLQQNGIEND